jgi:ATP-dependent Lhr-like helicase
VLLETYRECLRDFFDMPALVQTLADVRSRKVRVVTVDSERPSPFAASLLFSYVASFLYDGDAPLAERRAQALAVDQAQLRELLGDAELRELLDSESIETVERQLQRLAPEYHVKHADALHDLLLSLGDLNDAGIAERSVSAEVARAITVLVKSRRAVPIRLAGDTRYIAVEDAARYRDALGVPLPPGLPESLLEPVPDALGDLASRHARTHGPFTAADMAARYGLSIAAAEAVLMRLTKSGRLLEGEFRPGGVHREWTDPAVLRMIRRRSLARLRHEVEPVDQQALGRFTAAWQGVVKPRQGADALLDVIEQLQGAPLPASVLETEILPARLLSYDPGDLDAVMSAGEIVWTGVEPVGDRDGRIALYLADHMRRLLPPVITAEAEPSARERALLDHLRSEGASFFAALHEAAGGGYPGETVDALWNLVWRGLVTNDTFHAMRAFTRSRATTRRARRVEAASFRSRRLVPPSAEGRWSAVRRAPKTGDATSWATAITQQLLSRHGVVTREALASEAIPGGFGAVYTVLKAMEEAGRIRRGYFVAGLGATQFALPGALDLLRSLREPPEEPDVVTLAAADPANPYGATLAWPKAADGHTGRGATRTVGATVVMVSGALVGYLARGDRQLLTWLPEAEPDRTRASRGLARALLARARGGPGGQRGMLIEEIDGVPATTHPLAQALTHAGFVAGAMGLQATLLRSALPASEPAQELVEH